MSKFCGKCGAPLDAFGRCPNCSPVSAAAAPAGAAPSGGGLKKSRTFGGGEQVRPNPPVSPNPPVNPNPPVSPNPPVNPNPGLKVNLGGKNPPTDPNIPVVPAPPTDPNPPKPPKTPKQPKAPKKSAKGGKKGGLAVKLVLIGIAVLIAAFLALCALQYFGVLKIPFLGKLLGGMGLSRSKDDEAHTPPAEYLVEIPDADEYFSENGTIVEKIQASSSPNVHTRTEAKNNLESRGFTQVEVKPEYTMDGEDIPEWEDEDEKEPTEDAGVKYPSYVTYYVTNNKEVWTIEEINGSVFAYPVTYNANSGRDVEVIFTEEDTLTSYYPETGTFYKTVPNGKTAVAYRVSRIDAEALEKLTVEEIDRR